MKRLVEWTEQGVTRSRKIALFTVLYTWVIFTFLVPPLLILFSILKIGFTELMILYGTVSTTLTATYGFYTATNARSDNA